VTAWEDAVKQVTCRIASLWPRPRVPAAITGHREHCLRCQVDDTRQRSLSREIAGLRTEVVPAPPTLHTAVMARLGPQDLADPRRRLVAGLAARKAAAGVALAGVTATAIAVLTGMARWRSRPVG
jgi:hypothetical protein